jgi:hypothetical protein
MLFTCGIETPRLIEAEVFTLLGEVGFGVSRIHNHAEVMIFPAMATDANP